VVFYLDELKEVSEQTEDRVKCAGHEDVVDNPFVVSTPPSSLFVFRYIGQHRVIDRVRLKKVSEAPS